MKTLAKAFIEMAAYLRIAKFDDPDEAQGAEEVVGFYLLQASPEERSLLSQIARQSAQESAAMGAPADVIRFYEDFASMADEYQQYG
ncbi:MAG: hypothetical protein JWR26_1367 [Pedosphaera sp.]|nr:hypothetical protein [Pedosphaera sp.]